SIVRNEVCGGGAAGRRRSGDGGGGRRRAKSVRSGRRVTGRPYRPLTNRASSSLGAGAGAPRAAGRLLQACHGVSVSPPHGGRGRYGHRASTQSVDTVHAYVPVG